MYIDCMFHQSFPARIYTAHPVLPQIRKKHLEKFVNKNSILKVSQKLNIDYGIMIHNNYYIIDVNSVLCHAYNDGIVIKFLVASVLGTTIKTDLL